MSLLPYHKGNKTKFTNLLFPLIPENLAVLRYQMLVVRFVCSHDSVFSDMGLIRLA